MGSCFPLLPNCFELLNDAGCSLLGLGAPDSDCCFLTCPSLVSTKQIEIWWWFPPPSLWWLGACALLLDCQGDGEQDAKVL